MAGYATRRELDPLFLVGVAVTVLLHAGVFGAFWLTRTRNPGPAIVGPGVFVDAQLVKFGRPRDLSFLPHKQAPPKTVGPAEGIKVAKDAEAAPRTKPEEKPPEVVDPLKRTHAEIFKNLKDDDTPPAAEEEGVGSPTGSRAGTATEAKGDPYILSLIDQIGSSWTVPTTIKDTELANLSADVCLTIADSGALTHFTFLRKSGNSQFDSSLEATLGTIKTLPAPPDRFRAAAGRGRLCPTFSKQ
jgi:hypothetical protein